MPRESFDRQLREMQDAVLAMGSMVDKAIDRSIQALRTRDLALARQVVQDDARINQQRFDIEDQCLTADRHAGADGRSTCGPSPRS